MERKWVCRRNIWQSEESVLPGVWKHRDSPGYVVRGTAKCPLSGKTKDVCCVVQAVNPPTAMKILHDRLDEIRAGMPKERQVLVRPRFSEFAAQCLEERIARRKIKSAASREVWGTILSKHLSTAKFWNYYVDVVVRADIDKWVNEYVTPKVVSRALSPHTVNTWIRTLKTIWADAKIRFRMAHDPMEGVSFFETTDADLKGGPNSLLPEEVGPFLTKLRELYPQFYAFACIGFVLGLRPSHIRPLRRRGENADMLWDKGVLLVRRSETRGEVMNQTKTKYDQRVALPEELVEILRWHEERFLSGGDGLRAKAMAESDLLFPARTGRFMGKTSMVKPFEDVSNRLKLGKIITPRGMRRTAVDLQRRAGLARAYREAITGHRTVAAEKIYETLGDDEIRSSVAKVIDLAQFKRRTA